MPKKQKAAVAEPQTLDDIVAETFEDSLEYLQKQIKLVIDGRGGKSKHDPAYRVAKLTQMVAQVAAEKRKADAAERKKYDAYNLAGVLAWARTITPNERRAVVIQIAALDQKGSILS